MSVLIIAEAGVNHNGSIARAMDMVDAAVDAGADIVKFQTFTPSLIISKLAQKADYQKKATGEEQTQLEMVSKLQLTYEEHEKISAYCKEKGIIYLSTPFDIPSVDEVISLGVPLIKIPSGEITHYQLLQKIASSGLDVILSTGMSNMEEINAALEVLNPLRLIGKSITILHCNTEYPTPYQDVNLRVLQEIKRETGCPVGYSDHTLGIEIPIAAVALGASVIEKHFTLDKSLEGPDHQASLDPHELREMVKAIRNIELALGGSVKKISESEYKNLHIARKYLVAKKDINIGDIFSDENIMAKRVGSEGINPMLWPIIKGKVSDFSFKEDEPIRLIEKAQ